jgi:hypothetical protein
MRLLVIAHHRTEGDLDTLVKVAARLIFPVLNGVAKGDGVYFPQWSADSTIPPQIMELLEKHIKKTRTH